MKRASLIISLVMCLCLVAQASLAVVGDVVYFRDGAKIAGQILEYTTARLKIATTHGVLEFDTVYILKVTRNDKEILPALTLEQELAEKQGSRWPWILTGVGGCLVVYFLVALIAVASD